MSADKMPEMHDNVQIGLGEVKQQTFRLCYGVNTASHGFVQCEKTREQVIESVEKFLDEVVSTYDFLKITKEKV